jgi:hypothetical protein
MIRRSEIRMGALPQEPLLRPCLMIGFALLAAWAKICSKRKGKRIFPKEEVRRQLEGCLLTDFTWMENHLPLRQPVAQ